MTTGRSTSSPP